jgi:DNA ligase-1
MDLSDGETTTVKGRGGEERLGALITFRYQELSNGGVPRFPSFIGERFDAGGPWEEMARPREGSLAAKLRCRHAWSTSDRSV